MILLLAIFYACPCAIFPGDIAYLSLETIGSLSYLDHFISNW